MSARVVWRVQFYNARKDPGIKRTLRKGNKSVYTNDGMVRNEIDPCTHHWILSSNSVGRSFLGGGQNGVKVPEGGGQQG